MEWKCDVKEKGDEEPCQQNGSANFHKWSIAGRG